MITNATTPNDLLSQPIDGARRFEDTVLRPFAEWLQAELEAAPWDFLILIEGRGARLWEDIESYLSAAEGSRPVLYRQALWFDGAVQKTACRAILFDDSTSYGDTLNQYRESLAQSGINARGVVFMRREQREVHQPTPPSLTLSSYLELPLERYRLMLWQLSHATISRFVPPRVDDHIIELWTDQDPRLVVDAVARVAEDHWRVDHHGPLSQVSSAITLWRPSPAAASHSKRITFERLESVYLLADGVTSTIYLVPTVSPIVCLPSDRSERTARERARETFAEHRGSRPSPGSLLLTHARDDAPWVEVLYRAAALTRASDLVGEIAHMVGRVAGSEVDVRSSTTMFDRLYGQLLSAELRRSLDGAARDAMDASKVSPESGGRHREGRVFGPRTSLPRRVVKLKSDLLADLKEVSHGPGVDTAGQRVGERGWSLQTVLEDGKVGNSPTERLRALNLGLGLTSIFPFIQVSEYAGAAEYGLVARRNYRTSEATPVDDRGRVVDVLDFLYQLAAESVAATLLFLRTESNTWQGKSIARGDLSHIVNLLTPLVFGPHGVPLVGVRSGEGLGPWFEQETPRGRVAVAILRDVREEYERVGNGWRETRSFAERFPGGLLIHRLGLSREIETYLREVVAVLDTSSMPRAVLEAWSMCLTGRLGLEYVADDVRNGLAAARRAVVLSDRGEGERSLPGLARESDRYLRRAREKLGVLERDWHTGVTQHLTRRSSVHEDLRQSVKATGEERRLYRLVGTYLDYAVVASHWQAFVEEPSRRGARSAVREVEARQRTREIEELLFAGSESVAGGAPGRDTYLALIVRLARFAVALGWEHSDISYVPRVRSEVVGSLATVPSRAFLWARIEWPGVTDFRTLSGVDVVSPGGRWWSLVKGWGVPFDGVETVRPSRWEVCLEFTSAEASVLAGAVMLEHFLRVRSGRAVTVDPALRIAITHGVRSQGPGSVSGEDVLDQTRAVVEAIAHSGAVTVGAVSLDVRARCSRELQEALPAFAEIRLGERRVELCRLPHEKVLDLYIARLESSIDRFGVSGTRSTTDGGRLKPESGRGRVRYRGAKSEPRPAAVPRVPPVFVSYSQENEPLNSPWNQLVRRFVDYLVSHGIATTYDQYGRHVGRDWGIWGPAAVEHAELVICLASPDYRRKWSSAPQSSGAANEARTIRAARDRGKHVLFVVLPGRTTEDIPLDMIAMHYETVPDLTDDGMNGVMREVTGQPRLVAPPPGQIPILPTE